MDDIYLPKGKVESHVQNLCQTQTNHGIGHFYKIYTYATP